MVILQLRVDCSFLSHYKLSLSIGYCWRILLYVTYDVTTFAERKVRGWLGSLFCKNTDENFAVI